MHDALHDLITKHATDTASADEERQLDLILRRDPAARRLFLEMVNLDFALESLAADRLTFVHDMPSTAIETAGYRNVAAILMLLIVAVAACLALIPAPVHDRATVGRFAQGVGGAAAALGQDVLGGRRYEIKTGAVTLVTATGVTVQIESPAAFALESAGMLRLERGRLVADVPPAGTGFTVVTPSGRAIDLGTRFGVDVDPLGATEIHVFQGRVVAENVRGQRSTVHGGEAVMVPTNPPADGFVPCAFRGRGFLRGADVASVERSAGAAPMDPSLVDPSLLAANRLRQDPALIAFFDFEDDLPAADHYRRVPGRRPGTFAAEFSQPGDHMQVDVGGGRGWPRLTFAAWVRFDTIAGDFQSLYHTDGWQDQRGSLHWIITPEACMRLALRDSQLALGGSGSSREPDSSACLQGKQGRWLHLAAVYDADAKTARFYMDGVFDRESRLAVAPPAVLGRARIGNWSDEERLLRGSIDELVILGRAMADDEIRALFASGSPPR